MYFTAESHVIVAWGFCFLLFFECMIFDGWAADVAGAISAGAEAMTSEMSKASG